MARRNRFRRVAKWIGLAACLVIITAWVATVPVFGGHALKVEWITPKNYVGLSEGSFHWYWFGILFAGINNFKVSTRSSGKLERSLEFGLIGVRYGRPHSGELISRSFFLSIPLWLPFLLTAVPTAFLWYRDRRPRPGHCEQCGYNLTGNASGVCPECGASNCRSVARTNEADDGAT